MLNPLQQRFTLASPLLESTQTLAAINDTVQRLTSVAVSLVGAQSWVVYSIGADGNAASALWAKEDMRRCDAYFSSYSHDDPISPRLIEHLPLGIGCLCRQLETCRDEARRFEAEFMRPYGLSDALDVLLPVGSSQIWIGLSLLRNTPSPQYSKRDLGALAEFHFLAAQLLSNLPIGDAPSRLAARFPTLTPRELEIALAICEGMSNKTAARYAGMSPATVKTHLQNIFRKCGVSSRFELARLAS